MPYSNIPMKYEWVKILSKILVISDIHGNLYALRDVLEESCGWDELIVLGDLVDYGPHPSEVIDLLKSYDARIVRGNHDHAVAYGVDCRCGEATHWLSVWFRENVTLKLVSSSQRKYLRELPLDHSMEIDGIEIYAVHAAPSNPLYAYLYPWYSDQEICGMLRRAQYMLSGKNKGCPPGVYLIGHTHYQFYRVIDGAIIINPGSVGQPRDGDPRAGYVIINTEDFSISFHRVKYNIEKTIRDLKNLKIPKPYIDALKYMLRYGHIPSLNNLY